MWLSTGISGLVVSDVGFIFATGSFSGWTVLPQGSLELPKTFKGPFSNGRRIQLSPTKLVQMKETVQMKEREERTEWSGEGMSCLRKQRMGEAVRKVLFSCWVTSNPLQPHGLQHTRLPCPLLSPRVCSNSCPLSQWFYPTISSTVTLFSSCPQYFPASESFPISWPFTSGGQNIGASASASVLPMNSQKVRKAIWGNLFPLNMSNRKGLLPNPVQIIIRKQSQPSIVNEEIPERHAHTKDENYDLVLPDKWKEILKI